MQLNAVITGVSVEKATTLKAIPIISEARILVARVQRLYLGEIESMFDSDIIEHLPYLQI